ncbi:MAG: L-lactate permease, partial [Bryobacteraceae bacterium]
MPWLQHYDPLGNAALSTLSAAVPALTLFFFLAVWRSAAWKAALYGCAAAVVMAWLIFRMPPQMIVGAVSSGLVFGWFRITWLVVAAIFVYDIAVETGQFETMKRSIAGVTDDSRL